MRAGRDAKNEAKRKKLTKKPKCDKSRVHPDHPRCGSDTWICMCGHTHDVVIYSKFHRNSLRGFGAQGSKFGHSHYFGY